MTEAERIALIATIPPTVAALAGMVVSLFNRKKLTQQENDIRGVKEATNGMKDELVRVTEKEAHARGAFEEKGRHEKLLNDSSQLNKG